MEKITAFAFCVSAALLGHQPAFAAYTRATSSPVHITQIYTNEWGSPFVYVSTTLNAACSGGTGLYLYDITAGQPSWELRKNKMAVLLTARALDKPVILDYFYDAGASGWDGCYIQGVSIAD